MTKAKDILFTLCYDVKHLTKWLKDNPEVEIVGISTCSVSNLIGNLAVQFFVFYKQANKEDKK